MNKLMSLVAVAVISIFSSINAQNNNYDANVAQKFEEINNIVIQEEGIKISDNSSYSLSDKINIMPTATITATTHHVDTIDFSVKKTDEAALVPTISEAEIKAIDFAANVYQQARILRLASSKTPHCNIEALRSIYGNEKKVQEIAFCDMTEKQITENKLAINAASKRQTGKTITVAEGY